MPALAPVVPTQASLFLADAATVLGNSPVRAAGSPTTVRQVGSDFETSSMVNVLEPAFTAKIVWVVVSIVFAKEKRKGKVRTYIADHRQCRLAHQGIRCRDQLGYAVDCIGAGAAGFGHGASREEAILPYGECNDGVFRIVGDEVDRFSYCGFLLLRVGCSYGDGSEDGEYEEGFG